MPRKGPRRPQHKPKGKEQFCWSWLHRKKVLGQRLEAQGDLAGAEACHCHKPAGENGRCYMHGGTVAQGPSHHSYTHGKYSRAYHGVFAAIRGDQGATEPASVRPEIDVASALICNEMQLINAGTPELALWENARERVRTIRRLRTAGDSQGMAATMVGLEDFLLAEHPRSKRVLSGLLEGLRKLVDTEAKLQDGAQSKVNAATAIGLVESMVISVNHHVTNDEERAAIGKEFDRLIRRAAYPELADTALGTVH